MPNAKLELDLTCLFAAGAGAAGLSDDDLRAVEPRAAEALDRTRELRRAGKVGFFDLPDTRDVARRCLEYARGLPPAVENFVVLGIGGSALGGRALYSALARPFDALRPRSPGMPRRLFFPDNVDPATFQAVLELCPPDKTVYNVITKSGGTAETAAQLLVVADHLERALGERGLREHLVVTTDPEKGALRKVARELGLTAFDVPPAVGGRFSVLTAVGLLPAAVAGLDVQGLLDGARAMRDRVADERDLMKNPALLLAAALHLHDRARRRPIHVFMPYADALWESALWFQQLWAESLGKARDRAGNEVHVGPTPVPARGATDQHSQVQLFVEGPDDKVVLFLGVRERGGEVQIPAARGGFAAHDDFAYLGGHGLGELLDAEQRGTQLALARAGRPTATLTLERVDAPSVGELVFLLEAATAFAGPLYGVDPYDQPGVEEGKKLAFGLLGRPGYEEHGRAARAGAKRDPRFVL